jgi:hypothetical protein
MKPISFETVLTRKRLVDEIAAIEDEVRLLLNADAARIRLRDLRLAIETKPMDIDLPDAWLPTPENVNALPAPIRDYIHRLATNVDPAGDQAALMIERDRVRQLSAALAERQD